MIVAAHLSLKLREINTRQVDRQTKWDMSVFFDLFFGASVL